MPVVATVGMKMKTVLSVVLLSALGTVVVLPLSEYSAYAQAPSGPQGSAPPPQNPGPPKAAPTPHQPPQGGVTIAVDVPIVTLDVVATTSRGDIIPGLKKDNFRVLDEG